MRSQPDATGRAGDATNGAGDNERRGAIFVIAALLLVVISAFTALVVDAGYMSFTAKQLQNVSDAGALAGVMQLPSGQSAVIADLQSTALHNQVGGTSATVLTNDIEFGKFDVANRTFFPGNPMVNALHVTARLQDQPYLFAPVMGYQKYTQSRPAVAMVTPRDIPFVVDLSGSMNDDTEPAWATNAIKQKYSGSNAGIGTSKVQTLYNELGFGSFPGAYETVGSPLGVEGEWYAYAVTTKDDGVLTTAAISATYRILNTDSEAIRKQKAYKWFIDSQLARLMPNAKPVPNSSDSASYAFWTKSLDYVMAPCWVGQWDDTP